MKIEIFETAAEASGHLAEMIARNINKNNTLKLGVATGRTMDAVYYHLGNLVQEQRINCLQVKCFALDEYIGLPENHPSSFEHYLKLHLFDPLKIQESNSFIPKIVGDDYDEIAFNYENIIKKAGGIDLQILGVGTNGHIALNEPGSAHNSRTRVVALTSSTRKSNSPMFKDIEIPKTAMTMGVGTILDSRECILIATGESKAKIIQKIVNGDVNTHIPATALKLHQNATLILDKHAASLI